MTSFSFFNLGSYTSTEKRFSVYYFFSRLWFHTPIWVLFFLSKGFTLLDFAFINMFFWWSILLSEIPTGYIADYFGRKTSLVLSYIIQSIGVAIFVIAVDPFFLIISEVVWGIGITLSSGAETAWLYDEIQYSEVIVNGNSKKQANERFKNVYGSMQSLLHFSLAIGQLLGGFIAEIRIFLPHTIVAILFFVVSIWLIFIPEHKNVRELNNSSKDDLLNSTEKPSIKGSFQELLKPIILVFGITYIILGSYIDIRYLMQENLANFSLSYGEIGIFFALIMFSISLGNTSSKYVIELIFKEYSYMLTFIIMSISFILMSITHLIGLLVIFLIINFFYGVITPVISENINELISSVNRATILSILGATSEIIFIIFQFVVSYVVVVKNFDYAYLIIGASMFLILIPCSIYLFKNKEKLVIN